MKRYLLPLVIVLLPLAATVLWVWTPRTVPPGRASDLYRQYASNPHLTVSYIENFHVNDTLTLPVTTIRALDTAGWEMLKEDFRIKPLSDFLQKKIDAGKDLVGVFLAPKKDPTLPMDTIDLCENNVVGVSQLNRTISIFNIQTEEQIKAVTRYNHKTSINNL